MLKHIDVFLEKYILKKSNIIIFCFLLLLFVICAFLKFALASDGLCLFINTLYYPISHPLFRVTVVSIYSFPIFFLTNFTSCSFNFIVFIQGLWINLFLLFLLFINYLILPKDKKNYFQLPLLSYLVCMNLNASFITTETFVVVSVFFIVMTILLFYKIEYVSYKILSILFLCSIVLLKSYEITAFLMLIILFSEFYFFCNLKEIKELSLLRKFFIFIITIFFILAIPINLVLNNFDFYKIDNTVNAYTTYLFTEYTYMNVTILLIFLLCVVVTLLFIANKKKYKSNNNLSFYLFVSLFFIFLINSRLICDHIGVFRLMNFIVSLGICLFMYYISIKRILTDFNKIKLLNICLTITLFVNLLNFAFSHNKSCNYIYKYINKINVEIIDVFNINKKFKKKSEVNKYGHLLPWKVCLLQMLNNKDKKIEKILVFQKQNNSVFNAFVSLETLPNFERFGFVYSNKILEQLDKK